MRDLKEPPPQVVFVMDCIMVMMCEIKDLKKTLANPTQFVKGLVNTRPSIKPTYDKFWMEARENFIDKPAFNPIEIGKVSIVAGALCKWAIACSEY